MSSQLIEKFEKEYLKAKPDLKAGQVVRVHQKIKEGEKERVQIFEGLVMQVSSGHGIGKTFTVRKVVEDVGVEKVFPFHAPTVEKIQVVREGKVRRAKLYYMRGRTGKAAKLYEQQARRNEVKPTKK